MAAFEDGSAFPRKRITTYGKSIRRRVPEYNIATSSTDSRVSKEINLDKSPDLEMPSTEYTKLKSVQQTWKAQTRPSKPASDIYDMPSSDEDATPVKPRPTVKRTISKPSSKAKAALPNANALADKKTNTMKMAQRKPDIQPSSSASPAASNIFDFPSSDDEANPSKPRPIKKAPLKAEQKTSRVGTRKDGNATIVAPIATGHAQASKRRKLSPPQNPSPQKASASIDAISKISPPAMTKRPASVQDSSKQSLSSRLARRPKVDVQMSRNREVPNAAPKPGPISIPKTNPPSKSTSPQPTSTTNISSGTGQISPRGMKIWKDFLDSTEDGNDFDVVMKDQGQPVTGRVKIVSTSLATTSGKALFKPAGVTKRAPKSPRAVPRRRLIDTLVEQTMPEEYSEDEESSISEHSEVESVKEDPAKLSHDQFAQILSQTLGQDSTPQPLPLSQTSQGVGPKVTYSRQRSMLAEDDLLQQLAVDMPFQTASQNEKPRRGAIPFTSLSSFQEDEEMLDLTPAVTSVHELRQAGANQRFLEEVEDLLETIGKPASPPSSMRRAGLSELSSKLKDKTFLRQFRDNGIEQRFFLHLGQEQDVIAGFYIVTMLILVLADANMPHLVAHLRRHGITRLLIRLVGVKDPISKAGKDRKNNMSKMALGLLLDHQKSLLTLPFWGEIKPLLLSPRTVSLKCLELMVRQTREAGKADDIFSKEMTTTLFEILNTASDPTFLASPQGQQAIDFHLALSVLELHSIKAMTARDESIWISDYLPVVINTVEILLAQTASEFAALQYMLLRLVVNVTNNDPNASEVFAKKGVLNILAQAIIAKFQKISHNLNEDELCEALGQLVVALGVMINLAESSTVRECFNDLCDEPHDPLLPMVQLFMDNQEKMLEANTQEESQRNVAFGYLSILLGYLALSPAISGRIRVRQKGLTLQPLLTSIEQFISYHKAVDDILEAEEDGYSRQTGLTERLEALVERLRAMKGNVSI